MSVQLLFPFVQSYYISDYVAQEVPYIKQKRKEYIIKTQTPIEINEFIAEHFCNPESQFYSAAKFAKEHNPLMQHDGEVIPWTTYLK